MAGGLLRVEGAAIRLANTNSDAYLLADALRQQQDPWRPLAPRSGAGLVGLA